MAHHIDEDLFWKKIDVQASDACWSWKGKVDRDGYGIHRIDKHDHRAHRLAYQLAHGALPSVVMHTCDNPRCCNPHHLRGGTQRRNMRDKTRKNRQARGSRNGRAKLTEKQVVKIKLLLLDGEIAQAEIARRYGVSKYVIRDIKQGKTWAHIHVVGSGGHSVIEARQEAA